MLKLKFQYFGHLMRRVNSLEKTLMLGGIGGRRRRGRPRMGWLDGITDSMDMSLGDASAEMGLISPGGENLLDFLELWQVLSTSDGDLRGLLWWPLERPVPMRVARGPLGIPLPSMPVPKTFCGVGAET